MTRAVRRAFARRAAVGVSAVLAAVLAVVGLSWAVPSVAVAEPVTATTVSAPESSTLDWHECERTTVPGVGVECASLSVPVDPANPSGARFDLAVGRIPARDAGARIGSLVMNPGGPGVAGIARLDGTAAALPDAVRDRFDLVSFDPRGTGGSVPIDCVDSLDPLFDTSFSPETDEQRSELVTATQTVADACEQRSGVRLTQVSTLDTAHDLDALRGALGESRLNFLGFSYGTYLGALYAALFPDHVRALVLDGAVDPTLDARESTLLQVRGFEQSLDAFLQACARDQKCTFHHDGQPARAYDALRRRISRSPVRASHSDGRTLNATRFDAAVLDVLYGGRASWGELADALEAADQGYGAALLAIADEFVGRGSDGHDDDSVEAFWAISCLDGPAFGDVARMESLDDEARRVGPRLGAFIVNFSLPCALWPAASTETLPSIVDVAPTALVVGTTGDPATPLVSAKHLATTLGGASLLIARGGRHTAFASGNTCVDTAVAAYLVAPAARSGRHVTRC